MALAADRHVDTPTVLSALWRALRQVNAPTVFFRLPMQSTIVVAAQLRGNATGSADAPQFLIAPFNCATFADARAIRCDYYREFEGDVDASNLALPRAMEEHFRQALAAHNAEPGQTHAAPSTVVESGKDRYLQLVSAAREQITRGDAEKIVVSRCRSLPYPQSFDPVRAFCTAVTLYPTACVSLMHHPEFGAWLGASPELLIERTSDRHWRTVALAATRPAVDGADPASVSWNPKEREEQALVCRHIAAKLGVLPGVSFVQGAATTVRAGNMVHLRSTFEIDAAPDRPSLGDLLNALHPTSAVCGMPDKQAADFIAANEGFDRSLYAGYWGPLGLPCGTCLYVNIRCMRLEEDSATIFAGTGITAESDPQREWEETILKSVTMEGLLL
jgi:isochorismate synthase